MLEIRIGSFRAETHPPENPRYTSRLLLIHGLWSGSWCWEHFGSFLAHRGWEVVAADLRGRSGSPSARLEAVRLEDYAADVGDLIRHEALKPAGESGAPIVIGHDLGGVLALLVANRVPCRAVAAIAPPLGDSIADPYRRLLRRTGWWRSSRLLPPRAMSGEPFCDSARLVPDAGPVARELLRGVTIDKPAVPALIVGGTRDRFVDLARLEAIARELGCDFERRPASHWDLEGPGFERHVDQVHRWLVKSIGSGLLRLSGHEDVEED